MLRLARHAVLSDQALTWFAAVALFFAALAAPASARADVPADEHCFCDSGAWTWVYPDTATPNLAPGDSLCLRAGADLSQRVTVPANASVCVEAGAAVSATEISIAGALLNYGALGTEEHPLGFLFEAGAASVDNHGRVVFGNVNFNGSALIHNRADGTVIFAQAFALQSASTLINDGRLETRSNFDNRDDTTFINNAWAYLDSQLAISGTTENYGLLQVRGDVNINTGVHNNWCTLITNGSYNVGGTVNNNGLNYIYGETGDVLVNILGGGTLHNGQLGLYVVVAAGAHHANLGVDGTVTGAGLLYVEDQSVCQGSGSVTADAAATVRFFDASPPPTGLFDVQTCTLTGVVRPAAPWIPTLAQAEAAIVGQFCKTAPPCTSDDVCLHPLLPHCALDSGTCVECVADEDCPELSYCEPDTHACRPLESVGAPGALTLVPGVAGVGDALTVQVSDADSNADPAAIDSVVVRLSDGRTGEVESVTLLETAPDSGVFTLVVPTVDAAATPPVDDDGALSVLVDDVITAAWTDDPDGSLVPVGQPGGVTERTATARIVGCVKDGDCGGLAWACSGAPGWLCERVADVPEAVDDAVITGVGEAVGGDVSLNDHVDAAGSATVSVAAGDLPDPSTVGTLVIGPDGDFTFAPADGFAGQVAIPYALDDGLGQGAAATLYVTVNDPPTLAGAARVVLVGATATVPVAELIVDLGSVVADDGDDGDQDGVGAVSLGDDGGGVCALVGGAVTVSGLAAGASATCQVRICEELPAESPAVCATTTVTATSPLVPIAAGEVFWTAVGVPVAATLAAGDSVDPSGTIAWAWDGAPLDAAVGTITLGAGGAFTFVPAAGFAGQVVLPYVVSDGLGQQASASLTLVVNDPPQLAPVEREVTGAAVGTTVTVPVADFVVGLGVVAGDDPGDGDEDGIGVVTVDGLCTVDAEVGVVSLVVPAAAGATTCTVTVCEELPAGAAEVCATAALTVTVVNGTPVAQPDTATTPEDTPVAVDVTANDADPDGDALTVAVVTPPAHGTVELGEDGVITYTPDPDYNGPDAFSYQVCDALGACAEATVAVTVEPVNDPPLAEDDFASTAGPAVDVAVLLNDSDPDGDALSVTAVGAPSAGAAALSPAGGGAIRFTPPADFTGLATFTYTIADPDGLTAEATVEVIVGSTNGPPEPQPDAAEVAEDDVVTIDVLDNDGDPDGDALEITTTSAPQHGEVEIGPDGSLIYIPDDDFNGTDTFTYTVCDAHGACAVAVVTVTVTPVNDPPFAVDDAYEVPAGGTRVVDPADNDLDPDGDALVVTQVGAANGVGVTLLPSGEVELVAAEGFVGTTSFPYTVADPSGASDTGMVVVTVVERDGPAPQRDDLWVEGGGGCSGGGAGGLGGLLLTLGLGLGLVRARRRRARRV